MATCLPQLTIFRKLLPFIRLQHGALLSEIGALKLLSIEITTAKIFFGSRYGLSTTYYNSFYPTWFLY
ncbi:hypothetical protein KM043_013462 [Ampulex compressa]|nr:hypothetical protein KM043_013462 [Ampulex compressa]